MKKIIVLNLISFLILPIRIVFATEVVQAPDVEVITVLGKITNWLWTILLIIAVIFIIIAGYYFATASGNPEQVTKGKNMILYAIIGVVAAGMASGLVSVLRAIVH